MSICPSLRCCCLVVLLVIIAFSQTPVHAAEDMPEGDMAAPGATQGAQTASTRTGSAQSEPEQTFDIESFQLEGNTLISSERLLNLIDDLTGSGRSASEVEKARDILEKFYHDEGYPTVLVNIPEQKVEEGTVLLQIIESRIGNRRMRGNSHFSRKQILDRLPSLERGKVLYLPDVQHDLNALNQNADLKVTPSINPGKKPGLVEVELAVEDKSPFHGSFELSNRNSPNTTSLRLNGALRYDNLWSREHSVSFQYQTAPEKPSEVEVYSGSYSLPVSLTEGGSLVFYGVSSKSNSAFGEGFESKGSGEILGVRNMIPLPPAGDYGHLLIAGVDYKNLTQESGLSGSPGMSNTPVEYLPFSLGYNGYLPDARGTTSLTASLGVSFRGLVARQEQFDTARDGANASYAVMTLGAERRQKLPLGLGLLVKLDGQITDQPLVFSEQAAAGGMESVRGYMESEVTGDSLFHSIAELSAPDTAPLLGLSDRFSLVPHIFYDYARLWIKDALPGQAAAAGLQGIGIGVRGFLFRSLEFRVECGFALKDSTYTRSGDNRVHFLTRYQF